jgi:NhaP-type Na+/H+ or K+/H+ antiporter
MASHGTTPEGIPVREAGARRRPLPLAYAMACLVVACSALNAGLSMPPNVREATRPDAGFAQG